MFIRIANHRSFLFFVFAIIILTVITIFMNRLAFMIKEGFVYPSYNLMSLRETLNMQLRQKRHEFIGRSSTVVQNEAKDIIINNGGRYISEVVTGRDHLQDGTVFSITNTVSLLANEAISLLLQKYITLSDNEMKSFISTLSALCDDAVNLLVNTTGTNIYVTYHVFGDEDDGLTNIINVMHMLFDLNAVGTESLVLRLDAIINTVVERLSAELNIVLCILYSANATRLYSTNINEFNMTDEQRDILMHILQTRDMDVILEVGNASIIPALDEWFGEDITLLLDNYSKITSYTKIGLPDEYWITSPHVFHTLVSRIVPLIIRRSILNNGQNTPSSIDELIHIMTDQLIEYSKRDVARIHYANKGSRWLCIKFLSFLRQQAVLEDVGFIRSYFTDYNFPQGTDIVMSNLEEFLFCHHSTEVALTSYMDTFVNYCLSLLTVTSFNNQVINLSEPLDYIVYSGNINLLDPEVRTFVNTAIQHLLRILPSRIIVMQHAETALA